MEKSYNLRSKQKGFLWLYQGSNFCSAVDAEESKIWHVSVIRLLYLNPRLFFLILKQLYFVQESGQVSSLRASSIASWCHGLGNLEHLGSWN